MNSLTRNGASHDFATTEQLRAIPAMQPFTGQPLLQGKNTKGTHFLFAHTDGYLTLVGTMKQALPR